ncbi:MAG: tropinesterase [Bacteroidota bacterium]|nr:tropinesterase [Bacteroidota bacterium]
MLNPEKVVEKVPIFAQSLAERHGEHEWKSVMSKTGLLMRDLAHTYLTDQDFIKIQHQVLLGHGSKDNMVSFEETDYAHRLLKNSTLKTFNEVPHVIEQVPVGLLAREIEAFFK